MKMVEMIKRTNRILALRRARALIHEGELSGALEIVDKLNADGPECNSCLILKADIFLFQGELKKSMHNYKLAAEKLNGADDLSQQDLRYLNAYINFRKLAIGDKSGKKPFSNWKMVAAKIETLPATKFWKEIFSLPVE